ncbi:MAG: SDR family oxidoreductase, partial [Clostridia bacterium]|nr:SDR family oxidoreductase [Clostridia bacterium]
MELKGKVVIITGGGRGIGFGLSTAVVKAGAKLVITGRNLETLEKAKAKLEADYGAEVLAVAADGADEAAIKNVIEKTVERFGKIDAVINNAQASASGKMLIQHTKEDIDLAINSGIYATFFYMREAYPYLKETKGAVVNFASGAGLFGRIAQSSYAAAKEGIRGLSRVAATEWAPDGIRVNVICPLAMTEGLQKFKEE